MIKLDRALVVEGKYDKIRLSNIVDAPIFTTDGFRIFKNKEKLFLLKTIAQKHGIIILTDSDSAGTFIRSRLKGYIGEENIINVYLPPIKGKERRKATASAEGLLGVEGTPDEIILSALSRFCTDEKREGQRIEKRDLYRLGLIGEGSAARRAELIEKLKFPRDISVNALLSAINVLYEYSEFLEFLKEISDGRS